MSCIVLDIEPVDVNVIEELGVWEFSLMGMFSDTHFVLQKNRNPQKKLFGVQETCREVCRKVDVWIQVRSQTFYL